MKVYLSIDWDYFIDATATERITLFPDGGNEFVSSGLSDIIWSGRYSGSMLSAAKGFNRKISDMGVLKEEYDLLKKYLARQVGYVESMGVAESHSMAYSMFSADLEKNEQCVIINIDFHHDLYTNTEGSVDCGNWLTELYREGKVSKLHWVAREDSEELPDGYISCSAVQRTKDLASVLAQYPEVEGIFICRSGVWSPPHLDSKLIGLIKAFSGSHNQATSSMKNRYTKQFKFAVEQAYAQDKWMHEQFNAIKNKKKGVSEV